jgi:hypothetical protein
MRGQAQVVVYVLLFLISLLLVFSAVSWGRGVSARHTDVGRITAVESFARALDSMIQSVARHGGSGSISYPLDATIALVDADLNDRIEISMPIEMGLAEYWLNLTPPESIGMIRERKEGVLFRLQLSYPPCRAPAKPCFAIDLYSTVPLIGIPSAITVERNATIVRTIAGTDYLIAKVELDFK